MFLHVIVIRMTALGIKLVLKQDVLKMCPKMSVFSILARKSCTNKPNLNAHHISVFRFNMSHTIHT